MERRRHLARTAPRGGTGPARALVWGLAQWRLSRGGVSGRGAVITCRLNVDESTGLLVLNGTTGFSVGITAGLSSAAGAQGFCEPGRR